MPGPSPHNCVYTSTERTGAPRAPAGEGGREETLPPSSHNEPIVRGAGGGIGERDRPRRQAHEAAGGDARGSCYREFCACDPTAAMFEEPQL